MILVISAKSCSSGAGRRPRRCQVVAAATWTTRLERATPSTSATVFTAYPRERARATATAVFFWLCQIKRLAQDLVLQGLLAQQPLQLANLVLQGPVLGGRHHFLARSYRRQPALGVQPAPAEQLVWRDPMPARNQRPR